MSKVTVECAKPVAPPVAKVVIELSPREAACLTELLGTQCSAGVLTDLFSELSEIVEEERLDLQGEWRFQPGTYNFMFFPGIPF